MSNAVVAIAILVITLILFLFVRSKSGLVALGGALAMVFFGIMTPSDFCSPFGNDTVIMVLFVMILGDAVFETGAAQLVGDKMMIVISKNKKAFLPLLMIIVGVLSAFLSNTAVVAIFMPLIVAVAKGSNGEITKKGTYMAIGVASILGGNGTLAGSTPQLVAQGVLEASEGVRVLSFWELGKIGFPLLVLGALYYVAIGERLQNKVLDFEEVADEAGAGEEVKGDKKKMIAVGLIMVGTIVCFTIGLASFGVIAATAAVLCIATGCISFKKAFAGVDWNTVCVLAGAMGISSGLNKSGAIQSIAYAIIGLFDSYANNVFVMTAAILILSALLGNVMSHTATAAILTPMVITIAQQTGMDPIVYVIGVIIGCNLAFLTPIATPPLTMTMVAGYRFTDYFKVLAPFNLISIIVSAIFIPLLY